MYETLKQAKMQYMKCLENGQHLLKDLETNQLEIWANSRYYAGYALIYKNTHLEFCSQFDN